MIVSGESFRKLTDTNPVFNMYITPFKMCIRDRYWETELLEPYRNGWSFSPLYNTFDQDGEKIEVEGSSFSSSSEQIRVYRGLDVETIKSMTFIYDAYHRNMEFVLDLTQRREVQ